MREYKEYFAWSVLDMPESNRGVIKHKLNISPDVKPVIQKKRNLGREKSEAIGHEVKKLLDSSFIKEVKFSKWLADVVMEHKSPVT